MLGGRVFLAALLWAAIVVLGPPPALIQAEDLTSDSTASLLSRADLTGFLAEAKARTWKAPRIYSRWHVENVAKPDAHAEMMQARAIGRQFVDLLDGWAERVHLPADPKKDFDHAKVLLDFADWIGEPNGYGNVALAGRSRDIATVPLGRLTVNLEYPIEKVKELAARLQADEYDPSRRMEMLNGEIGMTVFVPDLRARKAGFSEIERTFAMGSILKRHRSNPDRNSPDPFVAAAMQAALASPMAQLSDLSFFDDDNIGTVGGIFTLSRMWEGKWHRYVGNESLNARALRKLVEWRSMVGYFPDSREGFRRAWDKYRNDNDPALYGHAWGACSRIRDGRWIDHDSFEMKSAKPAK